MTTKIKTLLAGVALLLATQAIANEDHHDPLAGHLSFKQNTLHMHASFPNTPIVGEESLMILEARDPQTHQTTEITDQVKVVLWMPSMGHGSAPTKVERAIDANGNQVKGTYNVKNVYFTMSGEWEIRVTLNDTEGNKETKSFKINLTSDDIDHGDHGGHN